MTYLEVIEHLYQRIEEENMHSGSRLPSIRVLSSQLNCNKETVVHAYRKLEEEHQIYAIGKSGYYLVQEKHDEVVKEEILDFKTVNADVHMLPYREFQHCMNQAVENYKRELFIYGETAGLLSLREEVVKHLRDAQVFTTPEQVYVTSGAQQALYILFHMEFPNHRHKILIEQPTYGLIHRMVSGRKDDVVGITRTEQGIDLKQLEAVFQKGEVKFFYCIPRNHNPLGTNLSNEQKEAIVALANRYEVYIIEDDYLSDMNPNGKDLPMHYYDTMGRVIYVKSYAKAFLPGVRLGIAVLPMECCPYFYEGKRSMDLNTSQLEQAALEIFLKSGMYDRHIRKMKKLYHNKVKYIRNYLKSVQNGDLCVVDDSGFFVWIRLKDRINESLCLQRLKEKGILVAGGTNFYLHEEERVPGFRLCIARYDCENVCKGIREILALCTKE